MPQLADAPLPMTIDTATTAGKLIAVAETLMGQRGFSVAMHEIAREAQQANKYSVQYHFGSREGLVSAVFAERARLIFQRRADLLAIAARTRKLRSIAALLEVIYLPIAEQVDAAGRHSFARFWLHYHARPEAGGLHLHPFGDDVAQYEGIVARMATILRLEPDLVTHQLQLIGWMFFASVIDRESRDASAGPVPTLPEVIDNAIALAAPALSHFAQTRRKLDVDRPHIQ